MHATRSMFAPRPPLLAAVGSAVPVPLPVPGIPHPASAAAAPDPPPDRFVQTLARHAAEVMDGVRSVRQLEAWLTPAVTLRLRERSLQRRERDHLYHRDRLRLRPLYCTGPAHLQRVAPTHIEACVTVFRGDHVFAVALRLEWFRSRWRACHVTVL